MLSFFHRLARSLGDTAPEPGQKWRDTHTGRVHEVARVTPNVSVLYKEPTGMSRRCYHGFLKDFRPA